jgi:DNA repair exonuclease SbcCD ATPase subunit
MRLRHAVLRQVRQHKHLQLTFHPRFTLIGGPNEAGKSTLVEALHKGLFLKATATGMGVEELRSRLHSGLPEVEIGFEAGGNTWQLRKRFSGASGTCQLSNTSGLALSGAAAEEQLAALLGVDGAIEGRRIGHLPQRWAHLWVRQGEAGSNLLSGPGAGYDLERLVQQLQQQGPTATLESPLDRLVDERIQLQLNGLFTATGKVKAGSPLALAQERVKDAQDQLAQALERQATLETAMEELRAIGLRLKEIDEQERPALAAQRQRQATLQLRRAEAKPVRQQWEALRQALQSLQNLEGQLTSQRSSQSEQQRQLQTGHQELQQRDQALIQQRRALESLQGLVRSNQERQELAQHLLALDNLDREAQQLQAHKDQFSQLQQEAEHWKAELAALPAIGSEQVRALRQGEDRKSVV